MSRWVLNLSWADAPHLSEAEKAELFQSIPAYQRSSRTKGIPYLGSGLVYPFAEERIRVDPFALPREWPRCFGLDSDAGAGFTAIVWLAWDRENSMLYLTHSYKSDSRSKADHVEALRAKGTKRNPLWIPGVGDAKGLVVTEHDSVQVIDLYKKAGVDISYPDKAVEAGVQDLYDQINIGKFKVFASCTEWFTEFRQYHRKDGKIVKIGDHLMDATRYALRSGLLRAKVAPLETDPVPRVLVQDMGQQGTGWLGM